MNDITNKKISEGQHKASTKDKILLNMTMRQQPNDNTNKKISEGQHQVSKKEVYFQFVNETTTKWHLKQRYLKVNTRFLQKTSFFTKCQ